MSFHAGLLQILAAVLIANLLTAAFVMVVTALFIRRMASSVEEMLDNPMMNMMSGLGGGGGGTGDTGSVGGVDLFDTTAQDSEPEDTHHADGFTHDESTVDPDWRTGDDMIGTEDE